MAGEGQTTACWCPGCGVFHAGATLRCRWKDEPNYPDPLQGYAGKNPAYDAEVLARMDAKYGGPQAPQEGQA